MDNPLPQKNKKSKIPYLFFIFFGVIFAVDFTYIYLAEKTWRGEYTKDGYKKGLKYNEVIKYAAKQKELGWNSEINYNSLDNKSGILDVKITDKNKNFIKNANITAKLTRPVQEGFDFDIELNYNPKTSHYNSTINFPLQGLWNVEICVSKGDNFYQNTKRFVIKDK